LPLTPEEVVSYAQHHIEVWNKRDIDEILDLYSPDAELNSPLAEQVVGSAVVRGRDGLRRYFSTALQANPTLHFEIVDVLSGLGTITIYMRSIGGRLVADVLFVDANGLVEKVLAQYSCSP
jgi:SnoaL-like domain